MIWKTLAVDRQRLERKGAFGRSFLVMNVAHEGEMFAVGGPGIHVDGPLAAEEFQNRLRWAETGGACLVAARESEFHVLVRHVFAGANVRFVVGDHDDMLAVW